MTLPDGLVFILDVAMRLIEEFNMCSTALSSIGPGAAITIRTSGTRDDVADNGIECRFSAQ